MQYLVTTITKSYVIFEDVPDSTDSCMNEENRNLTTYMLYSTYGDVMLLYYGKNNIISLVEHDYGQFKQLVRYSHVKLKDGDDELPDIIY